MAEKHRSNVDELASEGASPTGERQSLASQKSVGQEEKDDSIYLKGFKLYIVVIGLCISVMLVALDNAILATAIPTITTKFNSLQDVGWYGSAFLISICAFQPSAGKLFQYFSLKWTYLSFVGLFEVGSLICATAPSSLVLIIGRAVAGIGSAGLFSGALVIIAHTIPLRLRPIYTGIVASMFGIANIVGPLLGGVLTQHVSWRWCFYINLPCGAVTVFILALFFHPERRESSSLSLSHKIKQMDIPGFFLFAPAIVMLLLALQWGGTKYPWKSAHIIGLFCGFGGMILLFAAREIQARDKASVPPKIFKQRSVFFSALVAFMVMGYLQTVTYYLPIWFQVIKRVSPTKSGVMNLPIILGNVISSIAAGGLVTKLGYYNPWLFAGTVLASIGAGLISTFEVSTMHPKWIGYQVICGVGVGMLLQMPLIAVQATLPLAQVATGTAIVIFFQFLGGSIFLAIAQPIFVSKLTKSLIVNAPGVNPETIIRAGAESVRQIVPPQDLHGVLLAYNDAITDTFFIAAAGAGLAFFATFGVRWVSVKGRGLMGPA